MNIKILKFEDVDKIAVATMKDLLIERAYAINNENIDQISNEMATLLAILKNPRLIYTYFESSNVSDFGQRIINDFINSAFSNMDEEVTHILIPTSYSTYYLASEEGLQR